MKKLLMEFLGTFFFIFAIAMTFNPIAIAAMLMVWIYIGAYVSGAHYNPAVSLGMALRGKLDWHRFGGYMLAQVLGGFAAFALASYMNGSSVVPAPAHGVTLMQAVIMEILLSFVFVLTVLVVATSAKFRDSYIFGFAIGFSILALAGVGSGISGGLFNPAIALGSTIWGAISGQPIVWKNLLMYVGGSFLGAFLAAYAFHYFIAEEHEEIVIFSFVKR